MWILLVDVDPFVISCFIHCFTHCLVDVDPFVISFFIHCFIHFLVDVDPFVIFASTNGVKRINLDGTGLHNVINRTNIRGNLKMLS